MHPSRWEGSGFTFRRLIAVGSNPTGCTKFMLKNAILCIKDQLPVKRLLKNLITGNILGILYKRSHFTGAGNPKVMYNTKQTAIKASAKMSEKTGKHFSNYKCFYCKGFHIGKNSQNK